MHLVPSGLTSNLAWAMFCINNFCPWSTKLFQCGSQEERAVRLTIPCCSELIMCSGPQGSYENSGSNSVVHKESVFVFPVLLSQCRLKREVPSTMADGCESITLPSLPLYSQYYQTGGLSVQKPELCLLLYGEKGMHVSHAVNGCLRWFTIKTNKKKKMSP